MSLQALRKLLLIHQHAHVLIKIVIFLKIHVTNQNQIIIVNLKIHVKNQSQIIIVNLKIHVMNKNQIIFKNFLIAIYIIKNKRMTRIRLKS